MPPALRPPVPPARHLLVPDLQGLAPDAVQHGQEPALERVLEHAAGTGRAGPRWLLPAPPPPSLGRPRRDAPYSYDAFRSRLTAGRGENAAGSAALPGRAESRRCHQGTTFLRRRNYFLRTHRPDVGVRGAMAMAGRALTGGPAPPRPDRPARQDRAPPWGLAGTEPRTATGRNSYLPAPGPAGSPGEAGTNFIIFCSKCHVILYLVLPVKQH